jgi:hypothetical protein
MNKAEERLRTLTSLAILKVDIDEKQSDYLSYLVNFAIHILKKYEFDLINEDTVTPFFASEFGLNIPKRATHMVLRRMVHKGYLTKKDEIFSITPKLPVISIDEKRSAIQRNIEMVYKALIEFASKEFKITWTTDEATNNLSGFIAKFGVDCLRAYIFNTALPDVPKTGPQSLFIVSKFICSSHDENSQIFENIVVLVKGHMYANALLCPDLESLQRNFEKVIFYLDTPLVLNILGLQGINSKGLVDELVNLVKNLKGKFAIFEHTFDEIHNIITAEQANLDNPKAEGNIVKKMRLSGFTRSDLIIFSGSLQEKINEKGIEIRPTPKYDIRYQISEEELQKAIENKTTYRNPRALKYDINSIRSIYVLRKGKVVSRLEDAGSVFVTSNSALTGAAFEVGQKHNSTREVSSAITDYSLANVSWLKAPLGAPELPTKQMIATCYAAMEPSGSLWERYLTEIDRLEKAKIISADDHAILRLSPIATQELMNLTQGVESGLTGGRVSEILRRVKDKLVIDKKLEIDQERQEHSKTKHERDSAVSQNNAINVKIYWFSIFLSDIISKVFAFLLFVILFAIVIISPYVTTDYIRNSKYLTIFGNGLILFGALWGLFNWTFDISVKQIYFQLKKYYQPRIYKFIKNILGLKD